MSHLSRHEFLAALFDKLRPRTYLEIGTRFGDSLRLSRVPSIAIDPGFMIKHEIVADVQLVRATSDEFFARKDPLAHLPLPVIDFAFLDGMHLSDFVLRDFMNVERFTGPGSVIVFDDMLSRNIDEAARDRFTGPWTGDVYKALDALRKLRPDLITIEVNTSGSGVAIVLLPDSTSRILHDNYDRLVAEMVTPDPQDVPDAVLKRTYAVAPETIIDSPIWHQLVHLRDRRRSVDPEKFSELFRAQPWTRPLARA
jgi:hypothetical protein